jgi:hypothetical protein
MTIRINLSPQRDSISQMAQRLGVRLEEMVLEKSLNPSAEKSSSKVKAAILMDLMPKIHEVLLLSTVTDVVYSLDAAGMKVSLPTFRKLYKQWLNENSFDSRVQYQRKKKKSAASVAFGEKSEVTQRTGGFAAIAKQKSNPNG